VSEMPDDVVTGFKCDRRTCVVALTHDPKLDDLALLEALKTDAFYVGAIGSRRNNEARHARMTEHFGLTAQELQRLRGPIGIYIGSKTPPEIAVSIMAEILAVKNGVALPRDMDVAQPRTCAPSKRTTPAPWSARHPPAADASSPLGQDPLARQHLVRVAPTRQGFQALQPCADLGIQPRHVVAALFGREEQVA
jgi:hypothetical protein